jgi:hypothetical protein
MIGSMFRDDTRRNGVAEFQKSRSGQGAHSAMKTSALIDCLGGDPAPRTMRLASRFWLALGMGVLAAAVLFVVGVGPRFDVVAATHTLRFDLKFVETLALASASVFLCFRLMHPDAHIGTLSLCLTVPFLILGTAGVAELFLVPSAVWRAKMIGVNSLKCLALIPLLSIPPLIAVIYAMREGATRHPALSGALAGASAAGIAATLYASNCTDDSPLLVAIWYPSATLIVVSLGAVAGRWLLRW